jgi:hypothetical protein
VVFLFSSLEGDEWSVSRPRRFIPRGRSPSYPLRRRLGGSQSQSIKCFLGNSFQRKSFYFESVCLVCIRGILFVSTWKNLSTNQKSDDLSSQSLSSIVKLIETSSFKLTICIIPQGECIRFPENIIDPFLRRNVTWKGINTTSAIHYVQFHPEDNRWQPCVLCCDIC